MATATQPPLSSPLSISADSRDRESAPPRVRYLQVYNLVSAFAWLIVLGRVLLLVPLVGFENVHGGLGTWLRWTQTLAGLEVLHSLSGLVRSPVTTTAIQVASRFLLVWFIVYPFPEIAQSPVYTSMVIAWSVTEVIRYTYFYRLLTSPQQFGAAGGFDGWLTWLRYNTFYVLYPVGISSEAYLIYRAIQPTSELRIEYTWVLRSILLAYIPGAYIMYTHMMSQRRRLIRGKKPMRGNMR